MSNQIQIYILGKLMQQNTYPYQLKKELSEPIPLAQLTNLTESKLYYHFESLTKQGLIEPIEIIKEQHRPDKQVFAITSLGKQQLPLKIYEQLEKSKSITDFMTAIVFIEYVDRANVISLLRSKLAKLQKHELSLQKMSASHMPNFVNTPFINFIDTYHRERRAHEIGSLQTVITQLEAGQF